MPTLREQLLQAGLVTAEQAKKADDSPRTKNRRSRRGGKVKSPDGVEREPEVSDPKRLAVLQAVEAHRLREDHHGEIAFNFTIRGDAKIRKLYVNIPTAARLGAGDLAIVENGSEQDHVIVTREAVAAIRAADPAAVRFHMEP